MNRTVMLAFGSIIGALLLAIAALYFFGTPSSGAIPTADSTVQPLSGVVAEQPVAGAEAPPIGADDKPSMGDVPVTGTEAPAPDPNVPLAIEIPGCTCHSDDPKVVKEHEKYRMNQCAGCHAGETPTGQ